MFSWVLGATLANESNLRRGWGNCRSRNNQKRRWQLGLAVDIWRVGRKLLVGLIPRPMGSDTISSKRGQNCCTSCFSHIVRNWAGRVSALFPRHTANTFILNVVAILRMTSTVTSQIMWTGFWSHGTVFYFWESEWTYNLIHVSTTVPAIPGNTHSCVKMWSMSLFYFIEVLQKGKSNFLGTPEPCHLNIMTLSKKSP